MNKKNISKSLLALLLSFVLIVAQIPAVSPFIQVSAEESIDTPENARWKDGALATAEWDAADGADYYILEVSIYADDTFIGSKETGTDKTELDVQQQIRAIPCENVDKVNVSFRVKACNTLTDTTGDYSSKSDTLIYNLRALETIAAPTDIVLSEDGLLSFKPVADIERYNVTYYIEGDGGWGLDLRDSSYEENGYIYVDLSDGLEDYYLYKGYNGKYVKYYAEVESVSADGYFSAVPGKSNTIDYYLDCTIEKPSYLALELENEHYWYYFRNNDDTVNYYEFELVMKRFFYRDSEEETLAPDNKAFLSVIRINPKACDSFEQAGESGTYKIDLFDILRFYYYSDWNINTDKPVDIGVRIRCVKSESDKEEFSTYSYYETIEDFTAPALYDKIENLLVEMKGSTYVLSFSEMPDVKGFDIQYHIEGENILVDENADVSIDNCTVEEGTCFIDLTEIIENEVKKQNCEGKLLFFSVSVRAYGDKDKYEIGPYSAESNAIRYYSNGSVLEDIVLSPEAPILAVGNSMYLGKTVDPVNGYYENIVWSSDKEDVVSVDAEGKITALKVGSAVITAVVDESVTKSVTVNTYEVSSNIENKDESDLVGDTAGNIIDDISNNADPDISNTDIDVLELDGIKESILEGVENGDTFHTDIRSIEKTFESYKDNWDKIQKAAGELYTEFAGAYNIEVEMYHKNKDGVEYHIGNITELENKITFTIDLVGNSDNDVLVRVYKNANGEEVYDVAEYTVDKDGKLIVKSDRFSDFILLTKEEETVITKQETKIEIQGIDEQALTYGKDNIEFKATAKNVGLNAAYTWSSSDSTVVLVDETTGIAKAVGVGTAVIKVKYDSDEYYGEGELEVTVNKAKLTITGIKAEDKTYDSKTTATLNYADASMAGIIEGDEVGYTAAGTFDSAEVGSDKEVQITYTLTGAKKDYYEVDTVNSLMKTKASINAVPTEEPTEEDTTGGDTTGGDTTGGDTAGGGSTGSGTTGGDATGGGTAGGDTTGGDVTGGSAGGTTSGDTTGSSNNDTAGDKNNTSGTSSDNTDGSQKEDTNHETTTVNKDDDGTIKTITSKYDGITKITEKVVEKPDGSSTSTTTTTEADGTKVVEKIEEKADGSDKSTTTTTETDGTKTTKTVEKKVDGTEVTTSTVKDADGNSTTEKVEKKTDGTVTTTNTTKDADGASTTEKVVEKPDGSIITTSTEKDADGNVLSTSKIVEKTKEDGTKTITATEKNADGSSSTSKTTINTDGSSKTNTTTQNADGSTTKEKTTEKADGSLTRTATTTDEDGNVLTTEKEKVTVSKSGTETSTTTIEKADGSSSENVVKTKADGSATSTLTETDADGKVSVTVGSTKSDGSEISKTYAVEDDGVVLTGVEATTATASIPASVKVNNKNVPVTSVGDGAMKDNISVKKVTLAESITSIGEDAFSGAKNLKTIKLSANVTEIAPGAFDGIKSNATFYISAETDEEFEALVELLKKSGVGSKVKFKRSK
ncbi:MAG: Ig-like domain-containing protein [Lachnospiraceae bacterium]|nr:Ig-like domain-containing protein [Lachnospiraceae bacterium]